MTMVSIDYAQSLEYGGGFQVFVMHGNVLQTDQLSNYNGPTTSLKPVFAFLPTLSLDLSSHFPIFDREGYSIGFQPGISVNGMLRSGGLFLGSRGDLFLTFRLGAEASYANFIEGKRYYGFGAGYSFYSIYTTTDDYTDKLFFPRPSVFFETGKDYSKVKFFFQVLPYESYYQGYTGKIPKIKYLQFGITWEKWNFFMKDDKQGS
jgi:hypothetical protein